MDEKDHNLPKWLLALGLLVVLMAHTQVTLRHLALRVCGIRTGQIHRVMSVPGYLESESRFDTHKLQFPEGGAIDNAVVVRDDMGVFLAGELAGDTLFLKDQKFQVFDNTATHILLKNTTLAKMEEAVGQTSKYLTGYEKENFFIRAALKVPGVNFTLADLTLGILFLALIVYGLRTGLGIRGLIPSAGVGVFLLLCVLSLLAKIRPFDSSLFEPQLGKGIKELVQYLEVFFVGWFVFRQLLRGYNFRLGLLLMLPCSFLLIVLAGWVEYIAVFQGWTLRGLLDVVGIDSLFGFRFNPSRAWAAGSESGKNVLALYLTMLTPFMAAIIPMARRIWLRAILVLITLLGLGLILHLGLLICAILAILLVVGFQKNGRMIPVALASTILFIGVLCALNPHHGRILLDSTAMYREKDVYGLQPMPLKGGDFAGNEAWQQKYVERQAAMNAVAHSPLLGLGLGNYQAAINQFFLNSKVPGHGIEKSPRNLMEKDSHSLIQVQAVETGLFGVAGLLLVFCMAFRKAVVGATRDPRPWNQTILVGTSGVLLALLLTSFQASFMVRGLQLLGIMFLALPYALEVPTVQSSSRLPDLEAESFN